MGRLPISQLKPMNRPSKQWTKSKLSLKIESAWPKRMSSILNKAFKTKFSFLQSRLQMRFWPELKNFFFQRKRDPQRLRRSKSRKGSQRYSTRSWMTTLSSTSKKPKSTTWPSSRKDNHMHTPTFYQCASSSRRPSLSPRKFFLNCLKPVWMTWRWLTQSLWIQWPCW